jgi:4-amino-4-deoxy-L-arabinose transferase-like glycosyltransferase
VTEPLVGEAGWLLPAALLGIPLALVVLGRPWPLTQKHLALILWAGWLLPAVTYFSFNSALWHAYYLIMLGPPLAALVGITAWALWRLVQRWHLLGPVTLIIIASLTLGVQVRALSDDLGYPVGVLSVALPLLLGGMALLLWARHQNGPVMARFGLGLSILSLVVAPLLWSGLTALNTNPSVPLPRSGPNSGQHERMSDTLSPAQKVILDYLLAHTDDGDYLIAGLSSHDLSGYIIETGRPALTIGGFHGDDDVVSVEALAQMVAKGELRYVLGGEELARRKPEIGRWVESTCTAVRVPGLPNSSPRQFEILFDCGG